ncbi:MAG: hypothetical protein ABIG84_05405 [archaeon]
MSPKDDNCFGSKGPEVSKKVADDCEPTTNIANKDHAKKDTVTINEKEKSVLLSLNPRLYPQTAVMRASYRFIDDFDVIVDGDPLSIIFVTIKAKAEDDASLSELEELAHAFFKELIHANVEETQARRYADTRNALIGASLRSMMPSLALKEKESEMVKVKEKKENKKSNSC